MTNVLTLVLASRVNLEEDDIQDKFMLPLLIAICQVSHPPENRTGILLSLLSILSLSFFHGPPLPLCLS